MSVAEDDCDGLIYKSTFYEGGSLVSDYDVDHECMCKANTACNSIYYMSAYMLLDITVTARLRDDLRNLEFSKDKNCFFAFNA